MERTSQPGKMSSKEESGVLERLNRAATERVKNVVLAAGLVLGAEMYSPEEALAETSAEEARNAKETERRKEITERRKEILQIGTEWLKQHKFTGLSVQPEPGYPRRMFGEFLDLHLTIGGEDRVIGQLQGADPKKNFSSETFERSLENLIDSDPRLFVQKGAGVDDLIDDENQHLSLLIGVRKLVLLSSNQTINLNPQSDPNYLVTFEAAGDTLVINTFNKRGGTDKAKIKKGKPQ